MTMSHLALSQIQTILESAIAAGTVTLVTKPTARGNSEELVHVATASTVLTAQHVKVLVDANLLQDDGETVRKMVSGKVQPTIVVLMTKLKRAARAQEKTVGRFTVLEQHNKRLERMLRTTQQDADSATHVQAFLSELSDRFHVKAPSSTFRFKEMPRRKDKVNAGVPTLLCSDWHWGEVVDGRQIEHLNSFDLTIAHDRANRVFDTTLELLFHHQAGMSYDAFVCALGGDMFSGNIHDELRATNEKPIHDCLLDLTDLLADKIVQLAGEFPGVYVPGVVGNHGRIDHKPTAKNAFVDNYDYLLYRMVELKVRAMMGSKCNVDFDIATGLDMHYSVYNTRYLLTHGDQIKGGSGVGGFWPAMMKTVHRKQDRSVAGNLGGFDWMVCGHFHKYGTIQGAIVNGSLKGYDEWVSKMNFAFERPIQALWVTHPDHGITSHQPVYADPVTQDATSLASPITQNRFLTAQNAARLKARRALAK